MAALLMASGSFGGEYRTESCIIEMITFLSKKRDVLALGASVRETMWWPRVDRSRCVGLSRVRMILEHQKAARYHQADVGFDPLKICSLVLRGVLTLIN